MTVTLDVPGGHLSWLKVSTPRFSIEPFTYRLGWELTTVERLRMQLLNLIVWALAAAATATAQSIDGVLNLVKRRLPSHVDDFTFHLFGNQTGPITSATNATNDQYTVSSISPGKIQIEGNSLIALASG
jgi:hypothetical protein